MKLVCRGRRGSKLNKGQRGQGVGAHREDREKVDWRAWMLSSSYVLERINCMCRVGRLLMSLYIYAHICVHTLYTRVRGSILLQFQLFMTLPAGGTVQRLLANLVHPECCQAAQYNIGDALKQYMLVVHVQCTRPQPSHHHDDTPHMCTYALAPRPLVT